MKDAFRVTLIEKDSEKVVAEEFFASKDLANRFIHGIEFVIKEKSNLILRGEIFHIHETPEDIVAKFAEFAKESVRKNAWED